MVFQVLLAASCGLYFVQAVRASQTTDFLATLDPVPLGDRAAASAICEASAADDFVIYTGLSRAAIGYYLDRFQCARNLKQISYPAEFERHLGWGNPNWNVSHDPVIQNDAESAVAGAYASGARIFLLYQPDPRFSAGIVAPIERHFRMLSSRRFSSCRPCFDELRVYAPNSGRLASSRYPEYVGRSAP